MLWHLSTWSILKRTLQSHQLWKAKSFLCSSVWNKKSKFAGSKLYIQTHLCCFRQDLWGWCIPQYCRRTRKGAAHHLLTVACWACPQRAFCLLKGKGVGHDQKIYFLIFYIFIFAAVSAYLFFIPSQVCSKQIGLPQKELAVWCLLCRPYVLFLSLHGISGVLAKDRHNWWF